MNEKQYKNSLLEIEKLINLDLDSKGLEKLKELSILVEEYEKKHYPIK